MPENELRKMLKRQAEIEARLHELRRKRALWQGTLVCAECHEESDRRAEAWKAYQDGDGVIVFCADCAGREFDG